MTNTFETTPVWTPAPPIQPLISNEQLQIVSQLLDGNLFIIVGLFGIASNIVNIIVYYKLGFQDSITFGFFVLSISDLILVASPLGMSARFYADMLLPKDSPVQSMSLYFTTFGQFREIALYTSNILTAYLSIERCCCVIFPFKVKIMFTRKRSRAVIIFLLSLVICCYVPNLTTFQLRWMKHPAKNDSKVLGLWFASHREIVKATAFAFISISSTFVSIAVVICSMVVMLFGLWKNSKFRKSMVKVNVNANVKDADETGKETKLSDRDARLVKVMVFLGAIFTSCNLPYLVFSVVMMNVPELAYRKAYHNTYIVIYHICDVLSQVNASVNVFVYYLNSTRYRSVCQQIFSCLAEK